MSFVVATAEGLVRVEENEKFTRLADGGFRHVVPTDEEGEAVALADNGTLWSVDEDGAAEFDETGRTDATCVLADGETIWLGTTGARLWRTAGETLAPVAAFDTVAGRERWTTPGGGPPAVRSLDIDDEGTLYAAVHVGGVVRSLDGGDTWLPVGEIEWDVHQVYAVPARPGVVLAACGAGGLAHSDDQGETWRLEAEGLPTTYCRAVAVAEDTVLLSASAGPGGGQSTLYRRPLDGSGFSRCGGGLPDDLPRNIDTHCVATWDEQAVVALPNGDLYMSNDAGYAWRRILSGLVDPRAVAII